VKKDEEEKGSLDEKCLTMNIEKEYTR